MPNINFMSSPYSEGSPKRNDQQNALSAALRGVLGMEEQGSVLDPRTAALKATNSKANLVSILSDLIPAKGAAGLAGTFIGKGAKTWDTKAALEAAKLLKAGADPEQVRKLTGTSLFPDGKLRQEITDHDAILLKSLMPEARPDVLQAQMYHPAMQAAYPDMLRSTQARIREAPGISGEYQDGKIKVDADNLSNAKSTLLHETQHNIQDIEGFGTGGSPEEFLKDAQWAARVQGKDPSWAEKKAFQDYLRLAGEAEARLTQQRRMLTPEERRATPLEWDVSPDKQRVRGVTY